MSDWVVNREMLMWVTGIVLMLAGAPLLHFLTRIAGIVVGGMGGALFGLVFAFILEPGNDRVMWCVCGVFVIAGMLAGHYLLRLSVKIAFAVAGLLAGVLGGRLGCEMFGEHPFLWQARTIAIVLGSGVGGMLVCLFLQRLAMVLVTAVVGAGLAVRGLPQLHPLWLEWGLGLSLGAVVWQGLLVRFVLSPSHRRGRVDEDFDDDE